MENFLQKKQELIEGFEQYLQNPEIKYQFIEYIKIMEKEECFQNNKLFQDIFKELQTNIDELSRREIKQRLLMIQTYE